jgi:hypothetical protein
MALKMRATGLSSPVDEHLTDFTVLTGEWVIGRIYEVRGSPPDLRWFWSLHLNGPMKRSDRKLCERVLAHAITQCASPEAPAV